MASAAQPDRSELLGQLERIVDSQSFRRADRAAAFLRFVTEQTLAGNTKNLKEYTIAIEVFKRPSSYDPQVDSLVRVEARKLRARLVRYYASEGARDDLVISMPRGGYVAEITRRVGDKPARRPWRIAAVGAVSIATALVFLIVHPFESIPSLAVLPIENATGNADNDYIAAGIADYVTNSFSQQQGVRVVARDVMARYAGRAGESQRIAGELGVGAILSGRLTQQGERLSIQAELIATRDASQIWGRRFEGTRGDILTVAEEVARSVASGLRLPFRSPVAANTDGEAYGLLVKGRYFMNKRSPRGFRLAREYLSQSVAKDPRFAEAYAALTEATLTTCFYAAARTSDVLPGARDTARRALALAPGSAAVHFAMGFVHHYERDENAHERELDATLRLDPVNTGALRWKGLHRMWAGRVDEAEPWFQRALRLDPLSIPANVNIGELHFYARRYARAAEVYSQIIEMDPAYFWAYERIGQAYEQMGRYDDAIAAYQRSIELSEEPRVVGGSLAHAYAKSGRRAEARALLNKLLEAARHQYVPPYAIAVVYAGLGDRDSAFEWLEKAHADDSTWLFWLPVDPRLDSLRGDARLAPLLRKTAVDGAAWR
jgi:serine/threonine-protein kinase